MVGMVIEEMGMVGEMDTDQLRVAMRVGGAEQYRTKSTRK